MKQTISEILFEEIPGQFGAIGLITLNRPNVLNALNHAMFLALDEHLQQWEKQTDIKAVVIRATAGRAFCAGGDIRYAYELKQKNDSTLSQFFKDEYRMNCRLHHFSKPYIAFLDGITMGGGAGISIHGSYRVGTEQLVFAMPETAIGFYPDVGMTYILARLPYNTGFYLGLTGAKISAADCLAIGLVQELVKKESLDQMLTTLLAAPLPNKNVVADILKPFAMTAPHSSLLEHKDEIQNCFSKDTVEEILQALDEHSTEWCRQTAAILKTKSPTSLTVTLQALQKASKFSFDESMQMENNLTQHFLHGHDFFEGIRALIIDKDQKPHWRPSQLSDVKADEIEKYFMPSTQEVV